MQASTIAYSDSHRVSTQHATVSLVLEDGEPAHEFGAVVIRITPDDIRLALDCSPDVSLRSLYKLNRIVGLALELPAPHETIHIVAIPTGFAMNAGAGDPPMVIDLDFPDITESEACALRQSNPLLVVQQLRR